jgi:hypothetical protein
MNRSMVVQCTWMPWLKCKEEIYALPLKANCLPQTGTHFYHTLTNCSVQVFGLLQKKWSFKFHYCVNQIDGINWFLSPSGSFSVQAVQVWQLLLQRVSKHFGILRPNSQRRKQLLSKSHEVPPLVRQVLE